MGDPPAWTAYLLVRLEAAAGLLSNVVLRKALDTGNRMLNGFALPSSKESSHLMNVNMSCIRINSRRFSVMRLLTSTSTLHVLASILGTHSFASSALQPNFGHLRYSIQFFLQAPPRQQALTAPSMALHAFHLERNLGMASLFLRLISTSPARSRDLKREQSLILQPDWPLASCTVVTHFVYCFKPAWSSGTRNVI